MRIDCTAIPKPEPPGESSGMGATTQGAKAEMALQEDATGDTVPSTQQVLNLAAFKYLQITDPSKPKDLNGSVYYLEKVCKVSTVDIKQQSLIITVECNSFEILGGSWIDYCTGYLGEMVQNYLVTEDILNELGVVAGKRTTTVMQEEFITCRNYLHLGGEMLLSVSYSIRCVVCAVFVLVIVLFIYLKARRSYWTELSLKRSWVLSTVVYFVER